MSKKIKEIRILEDVNILDIYGQDEQQRLTALYHELEQQKAIINYTKNIQTNGNY